MYTPYLFYCLTHICLVDPSILINWMSPFLILGESGVLFFFFILFRIDIPVSKQLRSRERGTSSESALFAFVPEMGR